ncbi:hypothetical protein M3E18_03495 [Kocuria sp. p3-SID1433]|uniref:hypothetical protein n=1 Tax=unclassified Kocuria TaxID=2649579 RepID=UPI0021A5FB3D|nr:MULTISPECIES: hypothetical protein [unclassified Kocuria]MCT1602134.1 hypothetical protein [Kocuria sp. p3-SID1428]MCT2179611.1 hypothetical protein [Kocuria sp. p3-SID1433]
MTEISTLRPARHTALPEGRLPETGTRLDRALSGLLIVLSAFPYAGIAVGGDTNIPMSSVVAGILVLRAMRYLPLLVIAVLLAAVPFFSAFIRLFLTPQPLQLIPTITWVAATLALPGAAAAVIFLRRRAIAWLSWTLIGSAGYAVIQKHIFIDILNVVPLPWLYTLPGYANLLPFRETFLTYIRRPFGFFPETSFMVGTVTLMAMVLIVLMRHYAVVPDWRDWAAVALAVWAAAVSGSGSAIVVVAAVAMAIILPVAMRQAWLALLGVPAAALGAALVAVSVLQERSESFNWSWADRGSSILAVVKRLLEDPVAFWGGLGRGRVNEEFVSGRMPIETFQHYNPIVDIFSVLGRIIAENGMLVGGTVVACMALLIVRSGGRVPPLIGVLHLLTWVVIAGATISYDNAFWLWGGAGAALGLELTRRWPEAPVPEHRRIRSTAEIEAQFDRRQAQIDGDASFRPAAAATNPDSDSAAELPWGR